MQDTTPETAPPHETIRRLVDRLEPVRPQGRTAGRSLAWVALGWLVVVTGALLLAPLRPGAVDQLGSSPRFMIETLMGLVASVLLAAAGFAICVPGPRPLRRAAPAAGLLTLWIGVCVYALWDPALPPSMLGKRVGCQVQIVALGLPLLAVGLGLARQLAPLHPVLTGALLGAAAGAIPALFMQLACMVAAAHVLTHHVLPGLVLAALGAWLGPRLLRSP